MFQGTMGFVKGLGFGVLAVITALAIGSHKMKTNRRFRKGATRTMRTMDMLMNNISHIMR